MKDHMIIINGNETKDSSNYQRLSGIYEKKYKISNFSSVQETIEFINKKIDPSGERLAMIITDQELPGLDGANFLKMLSKTHPRTKKAINIQKRNQDIFDILSAKDIQGIKSEEIRELFKVVDQSIKEYESAPSLRHTIDGITFKLAENLYEKKEYFKTRLRNYLAAGHIKTDSLTEYQKSLRMEWDKYDLGGVEELIIDSTSKIQYLLAMKEGSCIGGVRVVDEKCPMEEGVCIENGFGYEKGEKLNLDKIRNQEKYRNTEIFKREISRLVVDKEYRAEGNVLFGLFRIIEELTKDKPTMMCTSRPSQISLYQAIGFERFGPNILYTLEKEWTPLIRRHWYAHNRPEKIEGMSKELHEQVTEPFPVSDIDKWNSYAQSLANENIKGFYS